MITLTHNHWLLELSLLVSVAGCYVGLCLVRGLYQVEINRFRLLISTIALIFGTTMWAAHFISMLAIEFPFPVTYQIQMTLVSALLAIVLAGVSVCIIAADKQSIKRLVVGGMVLGVGAVLMHFVGMTAFRSNHSVVVFDFGWVFLSVVYSVSVTTVSVWLAMKYNTGKKAIFAATQLAIAIVSLHHFSMLASMFIPEVAKDTLAAPVLASHTLAIFVSLVVFALIGAALLVAVQKSPKLVPHSPLPHEPLLVPQPQIQNNEKIGPEVFMQNQLLPVERCNRTEFLNLNEVMYIQADSHYSKVYSGKDNYFCNLSISDLEKRLPHDRFLRVHRSFIANLAHIKGFEKDYDRARLLFDRSEAQYIPISRRRLKKVHSALGV